MTELEQKLTGENKVLRDLLKSAVDVLNTVLRSDMPTYEYEMLDALINQIDGALMGAPVDLLG